MEEPGGYVPISIKFTTRDRFRKLMKPDETVDVALNRMLDTFERGEP